MRVIDARWEGRRGLRCHGRVLDDVIGIDSSAHVGSLDLARECLIGDIVNDQPRTDAVMVTLTPNARADEWIPRYVTLSEEGGGLAGTLHLAIAENGPLAVAEALRAAIEARYPEPEDRPVSVRGALARRPEDTPEDTIHRFTQTIVMKDYYAWQILRAATRALDVMQWRADRTTAPRLE